MLTIILLNLFLETKSLVDSFDLIFLANFLGKYFKIQPFPSKTAQNKLS